MKHNVGWETRSVTGRERNVAQERRAWTRGVQIAEVAMSYGLYVLMGVAALVTTIFLFGQVTGQRVTTDMGVVIKAVQGMYANESTYDGLTTQSMAQSERLPEGVVVTDEIWIGGQNAGLEVNVFPAAGAATTGLAIGGSNARFFLMGVGTTAGPVRDIDTCVDLVTLTHAGMRGVQVVPAVASSTTAAGASATVAAATAGLAVGGSWRTFGGTDILALEAMTPATAQAACTTVIDGNVVGGRVVYAFQ